MKKQLPKVYHPKDFEDRIYKNWEKSGYFTASPDPNKTPYTIVIPPPNITGRLHMGHALDETLQDILIRFKRMQGYAALWIPGTDHASIATEAKIVEQLHQQGISKQSLGREEFLVRAWAWKEQYGGHILQQLKKLGTSCDWSRERFTLDDGCSTAVTEVFVRLFEKGLIYQGERIINWCPHCLTSISDAEVSYDEQDGHFWHLRYPLSDGSGDLQLATTRPETMLGDSAVAVHPQDERYRDLVGKTVILPLVGREIPIVADDYVDQAFGTGVVKITPAHDPNDFEVGQRHNLPIYNVMTDEAHMADSCGKYTGMERYQARKAIVTDLHEQGFVVKIEEHTHNVGACYRCSTTVEPRLSKQWFVRMKPLAEPAIKTVRQGSIKFVPERFEKVYFHWMENIKDWCISRQLWWGHRIPAYYCDACGETIVTKQPPAACPHCKHPSLRQDPDTLDTWFSSALWPFSTLGWPEQTADLSCFYPTNTLVTGYDIIFFWVARMIFSALEHTQKPPFDTVLIHGLVRDAQGRKMSKSLGNGIDPLEVIEAYGADALRFMLANGNAPGNDLRYSEDKVKAARNFANKLWNAARFVQMNLSDDVTRPCLPQTLLLEDRWILSKYNTLVGQATENLERFEFGIALSKIYDFMWSYFCDWYIELAKARLQSGGTASLDAQKVLLYVLANSLKLLHPFMPFITEEIWSCLPHDESIMISSFPVYDETLCFADDEQNFEKVIQAIKAIRTARAEKNIPTHKRCVIFIDSPEFELFASCCSFFERLACAIAVEALPADGIMDALQIVTTHARLFLPMSDLLDKQQEIARLHRELEHCHKDITRISTKLSSEAFIQKAPDHVVQKERKKLADAQLKSEKIQTSINALSL